jgi:hypothetical protein
MEMQIIRRKINMERRVTSVQERVKRGFEINWAKSVRKLSKLKFHLTV